MIALVEGASRQKTPNEIALNILLASLTIVFLMADGHAAAVRDLLGRRAVPDRARRAAGLPHPDDHRRAAVRHRHRGMDRLVQHNVLAMSGRAVEAAGDVNTLLLDKTGTITLGNRQAAEFLPVGGRRPGRARGRRPALQPGGRDARGPLDRRPRQDRRTACASAHQGELSTAHFVAFTAQTRMSGVDLDRRPPDPQGRRRRGDEVGPRPAAGTRRRRSARSSTASPPPAARRWSSPSSDGGAPRGRSA